MTEKQNSPEQEINNAQPNPSASLGKLSSNKDSMKKVRTDGAPVTKPLSRLTMLRSKLLMDW